MKVFVTGGTGVIGRRAVGRLVDAGHEVTGVSRTPEKDALLESLGARPVRVDLFDPDGLRNVVAGHDAVVNLTTKIPPIAQMSRASAWEENGRIRRVASGNLVDAALDAGVSVFVQESLAFMYGEHGADWIEAATTPLANSDFTGEIRTAEANVERFRAGGGRGVVLRFGRFSAPDSDQSAAVIKSARRGVAFEVGRDDVYSPVIDADDAAAAVVAALTAPSGTFDIVDSDPLRRREQVAALAAAVGRRRLRGAPAWMAPERAAYLRVSQRVSNQAFRGATPWVPRAPSVREGHRKIVRELGVEPALPGLTRLMLWLLAGSALALGLQAQFTPRAFYTDFPFGRGWVAMDGRYNEHLIRDFGALNLALFVLTIGALFVGTRAISRVAAAAWIVYSVPHLVYHLRHLTMVMPGVDKVGTIVSLSLPIVAGVVILLTHSRTVAGPISPRVAESAPPAGGAPNLTQASARQ